ncbi:MAG: hypothetical protein K2Y56_14135 [Methylobacterium sp.]|uniref:hypothetical protein n=1 Tax=Methylobacterium sp. TaxID=409 RepID=UPI0025CD2AB3|nr:hypothetical protein [Methylobacterium sp.]MBX9932658.1 hypothetical protein [Methylobacterium sp.]
MSKPARIVILCVLLGAATTAAAAPVRPSTAVACPSLSNLRILVSRINEDSAAAAVILADTKADHLGCILIDRDKVAAVTDRVALNGRDYECLALQGTTICHWVVSGSLPLSTAKQAAPLSSRR